MPAVVLAALVLLLGALRAVGYILRRSIPYQKRPAVRHGGFASAFFGLIGWPHRLPSSDVERIRRLIFANQPLDEVAASLHVDPNTDGLVRQQRFAWADESASRLPNAETDPGVLLVRAYLKSQLRQSDAALSLLRKVAALDSVEVRWRLWAFKALRDLGAPPRPEVADELLGIVVEVEVDGGLDTLGVYPDGEARLVLHNGHVTLYHPQQDAVLESISALGPLAKAAYLHVPLSEPSPVLPEGCPGRFTFLTPAGSRSAAVRADQPFPPDLFACLTAAAEVLKALGALNR